MDTALSTSAPASSRFLDGETARTLPLVAWIGCLVATIHAVGGVARSIPTPAIGVSVLLALAFAASGAVLSATPAGRANRWATLLFGLLLLQVCLQFAVDPDRIMLVRFLFFNLVVAALVRSTTVAAGFVLASSVCAVTLALALDVDVLWTRFPTGLALSAVVGGGVHVALNRVLLRMDALRRQAGTRAQAALSASDRAQQAEAESRRAAETLELMLAHHPDGTILHSGGEIQSANATFGAMLQHDPVSLVDVGLLQLVLPEDRERVQELLMTGAARRATDERTARFRRADGEVVFLEMRLTPLGGHRQIVSFRDATAREARLQARLMLVDRLAAVGVLAAGTAHEINNPLTPLLTNLGLIREDLEQHGDAELLEMLDDAHRAAVRIQRVVEQLQAVGRSHEDGGDQGTSVVDPVIGASVELATFKLRRLAEVDTRLGCPVEVPLSPTLLGQALLNLLLNAGQALEGRPAGTGRITIRSRRTPGGARITIEDNGCGMSADQKRRIFEPFYTTRSVGEGTGLGLYLVHAIVQGAGGHIEVDSEPERGTAVHLMLPAVQQAAPIQQLSS